MNVDVSLRIRAPLDDAESENVWEYSRDTCRRRGAHGADKQWKFDAVLPPDSTQEQVYQAKGKQLVDKALLGYNTSLLAYGQSGSGKTYSMTGRPGTLGGITPRVIDDLFNRISSADTDETTTYLVRVSFLSRPLPFGRRPQCERVMSVSC